MSWWRSHSLRISLTLWNVAAMILLLAVYAGGVYLFVSRNASASLDEEIRHDYQWAAAMADQQPDGSLKWFEEESSFGENSPWLQVWCGDPAGCGRGSSTGEVVFRTTRADRDPIPGTEHLIAEASDRIVSIPTSPTTYRVLTRPTTSEVFRRHRASTRQQARDHPGGAVRAADAPRDERPPVHPAALASHWRGHRGHLRLLTGAPGAGADRAHGRARAVDHGRPAARPAADRQSQRRARPPGVGLQRHARPPRILVRSDAPVHGRRLPRAAHAAHRDSKRGRSRPARTARRPGLPRDHRQHARRGRSAGVADRSAAAVVARGNGPDQAGAGSHRPAGSGRTTWSAISACSRKKSSSH